MAGAEFRREQSLSADSYGLPAPPARSRAGAAEIAAAAADTRVAKVVATQASEVSLADRHLHRFYTDSVEIYTDSLRSAYKAQRHLYGF